MRNRLRDLPEDAHALVWMHVYTGVVEEIDERLAKIAAVLVEFEAMGATSHDIGIELHRLLCDADYYDEWVRGIRTWCTDSMFRVDT